MVNIFVEGNTDIKFLIDFIRHHFGFELRRDDFIATNSWTYLFSAEEGHLNQLRSGNANGDTNLVVFDADHEYEVRRNEITQKALNHQVELESFSYPNNTDEGDRESLLCQLANVEKYQPFSNCFTPYADCLQKYKELYDTDKTLKKDKLSLFTPRSKWTLRSYFALYKYGDHESSIDYTNTEFWNIDHSAGNSLRDFLTPYFFRL